VSEGRTLQRAELDPIPANRGEILRKSVPFSTRALVQMFCLLLPVSHVPTTSFFHDFSGTSFTIDEQSLLGLGLNYGLTPSSAFHTEGLSEADQQVPLPTVDERDTTGYSSRHRHRRNHSIHQTLLVTEEVC
jgi:hypothetical protein